MKRYVVEIDMYVYAEDDVDALSKAKDVCKNADETFDVVDAEVIAIYSKPFGEITEPRRVK